LREPVGCYEGIKGQNNKGQITAIGFNQEGEVAKVPQNKNTEHQAAKERQRVKKQVGGLP